MLDDVAGALARGRAAAEALMLDTFEAFAPVDPANPVFDDDGFEISGHASQGETPGKLGGGQQTTTTRYVEVGGVRRPVIEGGLRIPVSAPRPTCGDSGLGWEYQCTAVGDPIDTALLGRRFLVVGETAMRSHRIQQKFDIAEIPAET